MRILTTPHPFLKHQAKPVTTWDKKTIQEVAEMEKLLKKATNPKGVGLAATQVGLDKSLFIILSEDRKIAKIYINPKITSFSDKKLSNIYKKRSDRWLEGCLSIPQIWGFVDRSYSITLEYQVPQMSNDKWAMSNVTEDFSDVIASYIQHETDHLNGILFTDRILQQGGQLYRETKTDLTPI